VVQIVLELNPSCWRCVGLIVANTYKAQEGALGDLLVANTSGETSVGIDDTSIFPEPGDH
jgi:hypothetical protein